MIKAASEWRNPAFMAFHPAQKCSPPGGSAHKAPQINQAELLGTQRIMVLPCLQLVRLKGPAKCWDHATGRLLGEVQ